MTPNRQGCKPGCRVQELPHDPNRWRGWVVTWPNGNAGNVYRWATGEDRKDDSESSWPWFFLAVHGGHQSDHNSFIEAAKAIRGT